MRIIILSLLFTLLSNVALAKFDIRKVQLNCQQSSRCTDIESVFKSLERSFSSYEHFQDVLKLYVANEGIKMFSYDVLQVNNDFVLDIDIQLRKVVLEINEPIIKGNYTFELPSIIPIKQDDYFNLEKVKSTQRLYRDSAKDAGFERAKVNYSIEELSDGVSLSFLIDLGLPTIVDNVFIVSKSSFLKQFVNARLNSYIGKPFAVQQFKSEIDELKKIVQDFGYYLVDFEIKYKYVEKKVTLYFNILKAERFVFNVEKNNVLSNTQVKSELSSLFMTGQRKLTKEDIKLNLLEKLEKYGYKFSNLVIHETSQKDKFGDQITYYKIDLESTVKVKSRGILFKGNNFYNQDELLSLYRLHATEQAKYNYYDPTYIENFVNILREKYIQDGYVSVWLDKPSVEFDQKKKSFFTVFKIREGMRTMIRTIRLQGVEDKMSFEIRRELESREGKHFNPVVFKNDIDKVESLLRNMGYYYAKVTNRKGESIVRYKTDNSSVDITLSIELGKKIIAGDIIIVGNRKTRKRLIKREISFDRGDLISSDELKQSQLNLLSLGIFSSVQIKPVSRSEDISDILIFVREKDFGLFEVAPGVRTDIGLKVSTAVTYNNLEGMNKRISFQSTINRRFDLNALDDERRLSSEVLLEYDASVNYTENKILRSNVDANMTLTQARKRFYSYDADIQRVGYTLSQDFTRWFNVSFRQQLERISQYNATDPTNHGQFQIGSITPSVTFDFRDRAVNPTKGALFDLSYEIANPSVLSQEEDELTIDYYKFISRNRFYLPITDNLVFAFSTTYGIQETMSSKGLNSNNDSVVRIPSIKVFRIAGSDMVRGFEDDEINRVDIGDETADIGDVEVNRRAYMANIKFEPRYFLSDSMIMGLFYDAGRVFVDNFDKSKLRSSVGISFKYVTPVGTLDFDYGIKLLRKRDSDGKLDSPGRLHVSIGFF